MTDKATQYEVRLARSLEDIRQAQRLRYRVFVEELGGDGPLVDHALGLEIDTYDEFCSHLILLDKTSGEVVGVYRLLTNSQAEAAGQFYSETEYDLSTLKNSGRRLLELGRSCVDAKHRNGMALYHLWRGLAGYIAAQNIEVLFGVASFHGTDPQVYAQSLSYLHHNTLADAGLRPVARAQAYQSMNLFEKELIERRKAMVQVPALIKAYLKLGGCVGDGAYIDHAFNTIDICLVVDVAKMNTRQKSLYSKQFASET